MTKIGGMSGRHGGIVDGTCAGAWGGIGGGTPEPWMQIMQMLEKKIKYCDLVLTALV